MSMQTRQNGRTASLCLFAVLLCSIAVLWSWNTVMAELLGLPQLAWRHALALCLLAVSLGTAFCLPVWVLHRSHAE